MGTIGKLIKWFIGSADGKNYVISNDVGKLPKGARPAPLTGFPTSQQRQAITKHGGHVDIIYSNPNNGDAK
jgi:hypothetical protein